MKWTKRSKRKGESGAWEGEGERVAESENREKDNDGRKWRECSKRWGE